MKKLVLILSVSFFISCVSTREITQKDDMRTTFESGKRFFLYTDNKETYYFESPYSYQVIGI